MESKKKLLDHYATKEPHLFYQMDAHKERDGHPAECTAGSTYELMNGSSVRLLIAPSINKETVLALLENLTQWIKDDDTNLNTIRIQHEADDKIKSTVDLLIAQGFTVSDLNSMAEMASAQDEFMDMPF